MDSRQSVATACALLQFAASAAVVWFFRDAFGVRAIESWALALAVPGAASASMPILALLVPALIPTIGFRFPLNVTLPVVHVALMLAFASLFGTTGSGVVALPEALGPCVAWGAPTHWATAFGAQALLLSAALAWAGRGRRR